MDGRSRRPKRLDWIGFVQRNTGQIQRVCGRQWGIRRSNPPLPPCQTVPIPYWITVYGGAFAMMPIPSALLIHSVQLLTPTGEDAWQSQTFGEPIALSRVRVEPIRQWITDKDNRQVSLSASLIYDCHNSRPQKVEFQAGARIVFEGREYTIETVERLYDEARLHHIEVGLS
nr:MAG TPA: Minor capsid protein [Caudoviricetes sp.]